MTWLAYSVWRAKHDYTPHPSCQLTKGGMKLVFQTNYVSDWTFVYLYYAFFKNFFFYLNMFT